MDPIYYRSCDGEPRLYRVTPTSVVSAAGGGLDLSVVPPGDVDVWNAEKGAWEPATLPPLAPRVGSAAGCVRHTKNKARVGA